MPAKRKGSIGRPPKSQATVNGASKKVKVSHPSHCSQPGVVLTLGEGDVGQLGHGDEMTERKKPRVVADLPMCVSAVAGGMHTVCLTKDGEVYTFGCNDEGALGRVIEDDETEPYVPGKVPLAEKVIQISAGDSHTAALTDEGHVFVWGTFRDGTGIFGLTSHGQKSGQPVHISLDSPVVKVASGCDHLCMLTIDGDLYSMGCGEQGQLGRVAEIHAVRGGRKGPGCDHLCMLTIDGDLYSMGCGEQGQLGRVAEIHAVRGGRKGPGVCLEPSLVYCKKVRGKGKPLFNDVWCSSYCTYAKTKDGTMYGWGLNNYHHLGLSNLEPHYMPAVIEAFSNVQVASLAGGQHHTIILDTAGKVYSLGRTDYGRLGLGENANESNEPAQITDIGDHVVTNIGCGSAVSFACTQKGDAFAWGMGTNYQLGSGEEDDVFVPNPLTGKQLEERKVIAVDSGGQHTVLLATDK